jgi:malate dehydrogenase (quinone)
VPTAEAADWDLITAGCFPDQVDAWRPLLQEAIPSYGRKLSQEPALLEAVHADTMRTLELNG